MKTLIALCVALLASSVMALDLVQIPYWGTNTSRQSSGVWWTNSVYSGTNSVFPWEGWRAADTNFARIASALDALADSQTNAAAYQAQLATNSMLTSAQVTNAAAYQAKLATNGTLTAQGVTNAAAYQAQLATNGMAPGMVNAMAVPFTLIGTNVLLDFGAYSNVANLGFYGVVTTNIFFQYPTNRSPGMPFLVHLFMDGTGGRTVTATNFFKVPNGQWLTTTTNAGAWSIFSFVFNPFGATNAACVQTLNFQ